MPAIKGVNRGAIRTLEDLKRRCVIDAINDCWIWTQGQDKGNPKCSIWFDEIRAAISLRGRKAAYTLKTGGLPVAGLWVSRAACCAHKLCVNPDHCVAGNASDRGAAQRELGSMCGNPKRISSAINAASYRRKLTDEQAQLIRMDARPLRVLGELYGVSPKTISAIKLGRLYKQGARNSSVFNWRPTA